MLILRVHLILRSKNSMQRFKNGPHREGKEGEKGMKIVQANSRPITMHSNIKFDLIWVDLINRHKSPRLKWRNNICQSIAEMSSVRYLQCRLLFPELGGVRDPRTITFWRSDKWIVLGVLLEVRYAAATSRNIEQQTNKHLKSYSTSTITQKYLVCDIGLALA